jgi:hypothetical protein
MRVVHRKHANGRTMDIEAIVRQRMCRTPIGTAGAVVNTQPGSVIGKTVHSVGQIEAFQHGVYDKPTRVGGKQSIPMVTSEADWYPTTLDKDEWDSLPHIDLTSAAGWYPTTLDKDEWDNLHHFSLTSADNWDPNKLDRELDDDDALTDETVRDSLVHVPSRFKGRFHPRQYRTTRTGKRGRSHIHALPLWMGIRRYHSGTHAAICSPFGE